MLWHIEDYKIIIKIPPKTGCTSVKQFLCTLKNIKKKSYNGIHDEDLYLNNGFFITLEEAKTKLLDNNYKLLIITRNPYERFFSGLNQKFIVHHPNNHEWQMKHLLSRNDNPNLANFYIWFKENINSDFSQITLKYLIDYHTDPINLKNNKIHFHFSEIYNTIPYKSFKLSEDKIIIVKSNEGDLYDQLNKILNTDIKMNESYNKSKYNSDNDTNEPDIYKTCVNDKRVLDNRYYIEAVNKAFYNDFINFGYEMK